MTARSLRRSVVTTVMAAALVAIALTTASAIWLTRRAVNELRDSEMRQEAAFLLLMARHEAAEGESIGTLASFEADGLGRLVADRAHFRIWAGDKVVARSQNRRPPRRPPTDGCRTEVSDGMAWRICAVEDRQMPIVAEVYEPPSIRWTLTAQALRGFAPPLVVLAIAVCLIAYLQLSAALRPVEAISAEIDHRDTSDLSPLAPRPLPQEIIPLFDALNGLFQRLASAISREREFVDNAAHELRTPLAALKLRAQIAVRELRANGTADQNLSHLIAATDRASAVIDNLLLMTRLRAASAVLVPVDLSALTADVARVLAGRAIEKEQEMAIDMPKTAMVRGQAGALAMLVRNLLDNAIRYTPDGGTVALSVEPLASGDTVLVVQDTGPGISPQDRERALERFVRLAPDETGSGLGLSIVQQICEMHGAALALEEADPHGLLVRVTFPPVDAPRPAA